MSLRGLDDWITGHNGDDYWRGDEEDEHAFVCGFCRAGACTMCRGKRCDCPGRYGRTAKEHGPYQGPVKLVKDEVYPPHDSMQTIRQDTSHRSSITEVLSTDTTAGQQQTTRRTFKW